MVSQEGVREVNFSRIRRALFFYVFLFIGCICNLKKKKRNAAADSMDRKPSCECVSEGREWRCPRCAFLLPTANVSALLCSPIAQC